MRVLRVVGAAVVVAGCGGGGGDGGGGPSPQVPVSRVDVTPNIAQSTTLCGSVSLSATPRDAQGNALSRTVVWTPGNAAVIALSSSGASASATGIGVGSSTVTAASEGVPSTPVTVTVSSAGQAPATAEVSATAAASFSPTCVVVAAGGTVRWTFGATSHNVIFESNRPTGGDIDARTNTTEERTFPTAGHYPYQCTLHPGMSGRVVVQ